MEAGSRSQNTSRRQFFRSVIPGGCFACLLQQPLLEEAGWLGGRSDVDLPDPDSDSHWTYRRIYQFAYTQGMIPHLQNLADSVGGREALVEMLKASSLKVGRRGGEAVDASTFEEFVGWMEGVMESYDVYQNTLTWEPFEVSEVGLEYRITSCLWAETFRNAGAADFGYALMCHSDVGMAQAFEGVLTLERPSTLMEGGEACVFRFLRV